MSKKVGSGQIDLCFDFLKFSDLILFWLWLLGLTFLIVFFFCLNLENRLFPMKVFYNAKVKHIPHARHRWQWPLWQQFFFACLKSATGRLSDARVYPTALSTHVECLLVFRLRAFPVKFSWRWYGLHGTLDCQAMSCTSCHVAASS